MPHTEQPDNPPASEWAAVYLSVPAAVASAVAQLVDARMVPLSVAFYRDLLAQPEAARLIPVDTLNNRLLPSIQRWIQFLFDPVNSNSPSPTIALQRHVGEMHARAGIPLHLVIQGFRSLKREVNALLLQSALTPQEQLQATVYAGELADLSLAEMVGAHQRGMAIGSVFSPQQAEPERYAPLVALSDEENRFLRSMLSAMPTGEVKAISTSPFGLWLNHKAPLLFDAPTQTATLQSIAQTIARLDKDVLPRLQAGVAGVGDAGNGLALLLREVVAGLEEVRVAVNQLFDRFAGNDGHRDTLTQLFNRPLLASILHREMDLARRKRSTFSVMVVDIDHFSDINQAHGHEAGDRVLQHVAGLLASQVRSTDFVFRYGGEEFLILLVELDAAQSLAVAEKIRRTVESATIPLSDGHSLQVTLSLGVALYDGQPDPHSITDLADRALARAKGGGRNRVMMATD